jgi:hypothetical protein
MDISTDNLNSFLNKKNYTSFQNTKDIDFTDFERSLSELQMFLNNKKKVVKKLLMMNYLTLTQIYI